MTNELAVQTTGFIMPAGNMMNAKERYQAVKDFIGAILVEGVDYGKIPGSDKPCLLKPGAEKMCSFFGFSVRFILADKIEDWTGANHIDENGQREPFFYYRYVCQLWRGDILIAEGEGSSNSWEKKYRYRWVDEGQVPAGIDKSKLKTQGGRISEFTFAVEKAETTGKYGKPPEYWQKFEQAIADGTAFHFKKKTKNGAMDAWEIDGTLYQLLNSDPADIVNTLQKMAQKRALVAPVLIATNTSEYFTQDIDDFIIDGQTSAAPATPEQTGQQDAPAKPSAQNATKPAQKPSQPVTQPLPGEKTYRASSPDSIQIFATFTGLGLQEAARTLLSQYKVSDQLTQAQLKSAAKKWMGLEEFDLLPSEKENADGIAQDVEPEPSQPELPKEGSDNEQP